MASQKDKTDERKALEAKANEAGVEKRGRHFLSDEQLTQKIIEVQVKEVVVVKESVVVAEAEQEKVVEPKPISDLARKKAPAMSLSGLQGDDRTKLINQLEAEDPDSKYIFQSSTTTNRELAAKGFERTDFSLKNDIVCRTTKESWLEYQRLKNKGSYNAMQRIDGGTGIVGNFESKAKKPQVVET